MNAEQATTTGLHAKINIVSTTGTAAAKGQLKEVKRGGKKEGDRSQSSSSRFQTYAAFISLKGAQFAHAPAETPSYMYTRSYKHEHKGDLSSHRCAAKTFLSTSVQQKRSRIILHAIHAHTYKNNDAKFVWMMVCDFTIV